MHWNRHDRRFRGFAFSWLLLIAILTPASAQQTFTGRLSDSACAVSHQAKAGARKLSDRQCLLACIDALATYVLVDKDNHVWPIANQDAMGLPLYAGRPVRITGERRGDAIVVAKVEAIPAHLHIGHVMTNWRDTPGNRGFLPVAIDEARVAVLHAGLAAQSSTLDDIKLHAGHVLHALDPNAEPKTPSAALRAGPSAELRPGPGAGYGVKNAAAGALQHLDNAVKAEGATTALTTNATEVSASLGAVRRTVDEAIALAQRIRAATDLADARRLVADLVSLTRRISDDSSQAQIAMTAILKAEGLLGAPR